MKPQMIAAPDFGPSANCASIGTEVFFPENIAQWMDVQDYVKRLCAECPVAVECLDYALRVRVQGVWAGTTETERRRIRKERNIKAIEVSTTLYLQEDR